MHEELLELRGLELDQLVYLDRMLRLRSVTRAAQEVGLTQSAMSHALRRLRERLGDPLLVRVGGGMEPTPFAERLRPRLRAALVTLDRALAPTDGFDPGTQDRTFRIASPDLFDLLFLPALVQRLQRAGPGLRLQTSSYGRPDLHGALAEGDLDLAVVPVLKGELPVGHEAYVRRTLFRDGWRCFLRSGHPALDDWSLDRWLAAGHLLIAPSGRTGGLVDHVLEQHGRSRTVALQVESFGVAPGLVASTDLVLTAPASMAQVTRGLGIVDVEAPVPLPEHGIAMLWHRRFGEEAGLRWMMEQLEAVVRSGSEASGPL